MVILSRLLTTVALEQFWLPILLALDCMIASVSGIDALLDPTAPRRGHFEAHLDVPQARFGAPAGRRRQPQGRRAQSAGKARSNPVPCDLPRVSSSPRRAGPPPHQPRPLVAMISAQYTLYFACGALDRRDAHSGWRRH